MEELKKRCHQFLNTAATREIEPIDLLDCLRPSRIFDGEEEELIRNERSRALRQYCFFLKLLPTKGPSAQDLTYAALLHCGYQAAAAEWSRYIQCGRGVIPIEAEQFQATRTTVDYESRYKRRVQIPRETAVTVDELGGVPPSPQAPLAPPCDEADEPVCVKAEASRVTTQSTGQLEGLSLSIPLASVSNYLTRRFLHVEARAPAVPAPVEESLEVAQVVYGVAAPPDRPRGVSTDLDSAGIPLRTPESFVESGPPTFIARERIAPPTTAVEKLLNAGDVQFGDEIGRGFYAVVYVAHYGGRKVAVKKFRDYDEFSLAMFLEEVSIMKELNHRNVIKFIGYIHSSEDRQLWLLSEFVAGGALRRFCTPTGSKKHLERSLPLRDKVKIAIDCWHGLDYIHGKSLCHKDISPGNILVSNDLTQVKISDFGLAEFKNLMMTAVTQVSGTPMYYPPEFASENGVIRHPVKSDIYSMGASLCELFSEQWFWNMDGQPKNQFQVMFILSEAQRLWTEKAQLKEPDCWHKVPSIVQPMLKDSITPDYRKRKSAHELALDSQEILKELR